MRSDEEEADIEYLLKRLASGDPRIRANTLTGLAANPMADRRVLESAEQEIESRIARGQVGIEDAEDAPAFKSLFQSFLDGLTNRNADDDRSRGRRHLAPRFDRMLLAELDLAAVMAWIDAQREAGELSDASIRHNMNLLSRFFSWAIARGHVSINPVRQIPMGSRPTQSVKSDTRWLDDDAVVRKLIADLEEPIHFMYYFGNRSGLRTGEAAGLRMSDMGFLAEGLIRVRFSYDGPPPQ